MSSDRRRQLPFRRDAKRRSSAGARRRRTLEVLEGRQLLAGDAGAVWHNAINPRDVNRDNRVTPFDALLVINDLSAHGSHAVPAPSVSPATAGAATAGAGAAKPSLVDVNGDNRVSPIDALNVINLLATDKLIQITTIPTDLGGTPISSISAGSDFLLQTTVQDVRSPASTTPGVFAAYLNVSYDSGLASISPTASFSFDPFFAGKPVFDVSSPGLISGAGSFSTSLLAPGASPQKLWTVLVHAGAGGVETFTPSFDSVPGHEDLLYGSNDPVLEDAVDFVGASLTINESPSISVAAVSTAEGNTATTPFVFTVSLSNAFNQAVTVQYTTANPPSGNAATAGVDYQPNSGTLTFTAGQTVNVVTVLVTGDTTLEPDELFSLVLSNPTNGTLGTNSVATGTIINDDLVSSLTIGDKQVTNVTSGTTTAVFTVTLAPAATAEVTVAYATANGTAVSGVDYTATSATLTFSPGATTRTITVTILGDPLPDTTESFLVTLSNPSINAILSDAQAVGTILPAVPIPNLSFAGVSQAEGNGTVGNNMVFTANLSTPAPQQILVRYNTVGGTATDGSDYTAQTGTLTFAVGQSQALITIPILGDGIEEPSESFTVNLTAISGPLGTLQSPATGLILNDDGPATLSVSDVTVIGGVTGTTPAVFTVSLSVAQLTQVTVGYVTVDNTATANEDYLAQSGILTFAPGQQIQTITVPVLGSAVAQPDETFLIALSSASAGVAIEDAQGVGTIVRQGLTIGNVSLLEGNSGNSDAVFTVNLSQALEHAVTVAFTTANGTATVANNDYVAASGTLTFAIGETSKTITVPIVGDTTVESNETFFVNLSNATGSALFNSQGNGTILNDDGQRTLIELRLADAAGVPLAPGTTLSVGDHFQLQGYVQDIQESPNGIAAAYLDALYDSNVVGVDGPITFGPLFTNIQSGSLSTPGLIDEVGAFGQLAPPDDPGAAQLLFSIPFTALDQGVADFEADAADVADHQVLEYTSDLPVPPAAINFVGTSINVGVNVFTINNVSVTEGNAGATQMVFTVTRFLPSGNDATVVYSTLDGTATAGQDYTAASGTLTFTGAETSHTITILVNGDTTDEEDEKFFLALSNPVGAGASQSPGVGTIVDDDGPPTLSIGAAAGSEGGDLVFTVSLSATSGKTVKVAYTTADALSAPFATAGTDYDIAAGTLTFAPGTTQQTITVHALPDLLVDPNEKFRVLLSDPTNATLAAGAGQGTITDIPPARILGFVYADINNNGIKEPSEVGIAGVTVRATRVGTTISQTTTTGEDGSYALVGLQPGTYTLTEVQPGFYIDGRDTHLGLESPTNDQFDGIVLVPSGAASDYNFGEQGVRSEFVSVFLNRRAFFASSIITGHFGPPATTTSLNLQSGDIWVSVDGGWDGVRTYLAQFNAANGSATMTLYNNAVQKVAESTATTGGAQLTYNGTAGAAYFIRISGTNPNVSLQSIDTVSIGNVSKFEGTGGTTDFVFTVTLSGPQSQTVTANYGTADGTATAASGDYTVKNGTVSFAPGETKKLITVVVSADSIQEADEKFSVLLSSPSNIAMGASTGSGTIRNDDITNFDSSMLFSGGGGSAAPGVAEPGVQASTTTSPPPVSSTASTQQTAVAGSAPLYGAANSNDAALEDDEDWVTQSLLG